MELNQHYYIGNDMLHNYKYAILAPTIWISHTPNLHETETLGICKPKLRMIDADWKGISSSKMIQYILKNK